MLGAGRPRCPLKIRCTTMFGQFTVRQCCGLLVFLWVCSVLAAYLPQLSYVYHDWAAGRQFVREAREIDSDTDAGPLELAIAQDFKSWAADVQRALKSMPVTDELLPVSVEWARDPVNAETRWSNMFDAANSAQPDPNGYVMVTPYANFNNQLIGFVMGTIIALWTNRTMVLPRFRDLYYNYEGRGAGAGAGGCELYAPFFRYFDPFAFQVNLDHKFISAQGFRKLHPEPAQLVTLDAHVFATEQGLPK